MNSPVLALSHHSSPCVAPVGGLAETITSLVEPTQSVPLHTSNCCWLVSKYVSPAVGGLPYGSVVGRLLRAPYQVEWNCVHAFSASCAYSCVLLTTFNQ